MLKDIKIVFVAYFADYITQASDLSKLFRDEGATVFTTSKKKNVILRAYEIAKTLITERNNFDVVVIQSHSYLNFLYTPFSVVMKKLATFSRLLKSSIKKLGSWKMTKNLLLIVLEVKICYFKYQ